MDDFLMLASARRSIRKFKEGDIPPGDVEYFIKAAVTAPSGCNSQNWHFVAVRNRELIDRIGEAVINKAEELLKVKKDLAPEYLASKRKILTFFTNAPVVIAVFMTGSIFYDPIFKSAINDNGYTDEAFTSLLSNYDILSIGAAVQSLLLAVQEKGYGACWMNEPAIAGPEINKILGIPGEQRFMSLIPIGVPAYIPQNKDMKLMDEVFTVID